MSDNGVFYDCIKFRIDRAVVAFELCYRNSRVLVY